MKLLFPMNRLQINPLSALGGFLKFLPAIIILGLIFLNSGCGGNLSSGNDYASWGGMSKEEWMAQRKKKDEEEKLADTKVKEESIKKKKSRTSALPPPPPPPPGTTKSAKADATSNKAKITPLKTNNKILTCG